MKTSQGYFYIKFLPIDPFHLNLTHWTFKKRGHTVATSWLVSCLHFPPCNVSGLRSIKAFSHLGRELVCEGPVSAPSSKSNISFHVRPHTTWLTTKQPPRNLKDKHLRSLWACLSIHMWCRCFTEMSKTLNDPHILCLGKEDYNLKCRASFFF